jgi:putative membrane protein
MILRLNQHRSRPGAKTMEETMSKSKLITATAPLALALALAACGNNETGGAPDQQNQAANAVQDQTSAAVGAAAAPTAATTTEGFITNAVIGGLYEVEAGRIAMERSKTPQVKSLGQTMVTDHTKAGDALKPIAAQLNVRVPTILDKRHQGLIDNLRGASDQDFDKIYLDQQEAAHAETVSLLQNYDRMGDQPALKTWAIQTLPVIQAHERAIDALDAADVGESH